MFNHGLAVVCVFMMNELSMTRSSKTANVQPRLGRGLRFRMNELSMTRSSKTANVQPRLGRGLRFYDE